MNPPLMPAASQSGHPLALALGFCLGFSLLLVINAVLQDPETSTESDRTRPILLLMLPFLVDSLIEAIAVLLMVVAIMTNSGNQQMKPQQMKKNPSYHTSLN